jgi:hypothetical protein
MSEKEKGMDLSQVTFGQVVEAKVKRKAREGAILLLAAVGSYQIAKNGASALLDWSQVAINLNFRLGQHTYTLGVGNRPDISPELLKAKGMHPIDADTFGVFLLARDLETSISKVEEDVPTATPISQSTSESSPIEIFSSSTQTPIS